MIKILYTLCALDGSWCNDYAIPTEFSNSYACMMHAQAILAQQYREGTQITQFACRADDRRAEHKGADSVAQ